MALPAPSVTISLRDTAELLQRRRRQSRGWSGRFSPTRRALGRLRLFVNLQTSRRPKIDRIDLGALRTVSDGEFFGVERHVDDYAVVGPVEGDCTAQLASHAPV